MPELTNEMQFRSALNGFNREDVVAYIEKLTQEHETELAVLRERNAQLSHELEAANENLARLGDSQITQEEMEAARERIGQLLNENQALEDRVAELEGSLSASEAGETEAPADVTEQDLTAPIPEISEVLPADVAPSRDYTEMELAAYRRAELAERVARDRAADVYREISSVFQHADSRLGVGKADLAEMTKAVQSDVSQLLHVLESIRSIYSEAEVSFNAVREKNQPLEP